MVFAGVDKTGNRVFGTHPSGTYRGYRARAEGAGRETVFSILKEEYKDEVGLKETTKLAVKCLAKALEARQLPPRVKLAVISAEDKKLDILSDDKVDGMLKELGVGK
jgi:20S proteasome subunit alpha 3